MSDDGPLLCPSCAAAHDLDERFCRHCGMPLVYAPGAVEPHPLTERHERARKVKRQYTEGALVQVAGARNQSEAEFIQGMLLEEGVPSILRRTRGFDVPEMLAAGPRDVLVPESGYETAREILLQADLAPREGAVAEPRRIAYGLLGAVAVVGLIAWLGTEFAG